MATADDSFVQCAVQESIIVPNQEASGCPVDANQVLIPEKWLIHDSENILALVVGQLGNLGRVSRAGEETCSVGKVTSCHQWVECGEFGCIDVYAFHSDHCPRAIVSFG